MLLPIGDNNKIRITPIVTYLLVSINILIFLYEMYLLINSGEIPLNRFFKAFSVVPLEITTGRDLPPLIAPWPIYATILTSMFMHGSITHIAGNMLYLWIFGDNVEDALGSIKFVLFYLICGLAATLTQILTSPKSLTPLLGASGAIAGVLGAYIVLFPYQRVKVWVGWIGIVEMPAIIVIGMWAALQFINGYSALTQAQRGGVAYWAHIGGFVAGVVLVLLLRATKSLAKGSKRR